MFDQVLAANEQLKTQYRRNQEDADAQNRRFVVTAAALVAWVVGVFCGMVLILSLSN